MVILKVAYLFGFVDFWAVLLEGMWYDVLEKNVIRLGWHVVSLESLVLHTQSFNPILSCRHQQNMHSHILKDLKDIPQTSNVDFILICSRSFVQSCPWRATTRPTGFWSSVWVGCDFKSRWWREHGNLPKAYCNKWFGASGWSFSCFGFGAA